jgi:O-antigen/teichoic acid export membrane protein
MVYFYRKGQLHFTFSVSRVTKKFYRKILTLIGLFWGAGLVFNVASVIDTIIIAAVIPNGAGFAGIFTLAQNMSSLMQAPQRAIISASIGPLSQSWKEKNLDKINRIYHHSSINQLLFASALFCLIWLNFDDLITTFKLQEDYRMAKWVFFFIGLTKIVDMGTGVNAQIISTSTHWKFDFKSGMILLALALPLNWQLTRYLGVVGPAISNLIAFTIYNTIRYLFLWKKFKMQPFTEKTAYAILLATACFFICFWIFQSQSGILWIGVRSALFCILFGAGMIGMKLSPDIQPVWATVKKRLRIGN